CYGLCLLLLEFVIHLKFCKLFIDRNAVYAVIEDAEFAMMIISSLVITKSRFYFCKLFLYRCRPLDVALFFDHLQCSCSIIARLVELTKSTINFGEHYIR